MRELELRPGTPAPVKKHERSRAIAMNWIRGLFSRRRLYEDLSEEIRAHLEERTQELVASGLGKEDAATQARREFGNITLIEERGREVWQWPVMDSFLADVRFGLRVLRKSPGFTAVAVLTLALGIGANTAIFSLINAVALRSLPVPNPQQLVILQWQAHDGPSTNNSYNFGGCHQPSYVNTGCSFSYPMFEQMRAQQTTFYGVCAFVPRSVDIVVNGQPSQLNGAFVSGDFFPVLGTRAAIGRTIDPLDDAPGAQPVMVLGYAYWQDRLGGDPKVIGKTAIVNRQAVRIVGVAQSGFQLDPGIPMDFWIPLIDQPDIDPYLPKRTASNSIWLMLMARLKPGINPSLAQAALNTIFVPASTTGPKPIFRSSDAPQVVLASASSGLSSLSEEFSASLSVLMTAVGLILLIACANIAGLMLARSSAREKEMTVRKVLGAPRSRLVRQLLTESLLLSLAGGALGIVLAVIFARSLTSFFSRNWYQPLQLDVAMDERVLAFTFVVSLGVGILFGLAPALRSSGVDRTPVLYQKAVQSGIAGKRSLLVNNILIVAQVAVSILLLDGAALFVHTLRNLGNINPGFDTRNVLIASVDMRLAGYRVFGDTRAYSVESAIRDRLASLPGVISASYSDVALLSGGELDTEFNLPGRLQSSALSADELPVGPGFFDTMRIPIIAGRTFTSADFESSAKPEPLIINQSFARKLFGNENPLGREVSEAYADKPRWTVVGVVPDSKYDSLRKEIRPTAYILDRNTGAVFELRTSSDPRALIPWVRDAVRRVDANFLVASVKTQSEQIDQSLYKERLLAALSSLFGILAIVLVSIGLYGLVAYGVARRTHEIGVRIALGAHPRQILRLMATQGLVLTAIGVLLGVGAAAAVSRYLESLLYGVRPVDPWTFASMAILLGGVAAIACHVPARRATRVDPMVALKYE
jgi:predicted permease